MAESLAHKFGQVIGDLLELAIEPRLRRFATQNKLYLDKKGIRLTRSGKKLSWIDSNKNSHDLDFVLERGGTDDKLGEPIAFIETAWRRYTKHSRNKAQEIQGAILPLAEKYRSSSPFIGVVLAGEFTSGALTQLRSSGFCVLHFSYDTVVRAFSKFNLDVAFDETTSEKEFKKKINDWNRIPDKSEISKELLNSNKQEVIEFFDALSRSVSRYVDRVIILPLHGKESMANSISTAISFLKSYDEKQTERPIHKYELIIKYNTGDRIDASFLDKKDAIKFLEKYL